VRNKFEQAGGELPLMNTFKTYDTDNDGLLTSQEFLKSLTRSKIFVKKEDIDAIYNMIDEERRDNISYREITDVLYGRKHLDTINLIKKQRIKDGRATGLTED
jgi:Ca2+-binding EF-hand superfamily protein